MLYIFKIFFIWLITDLVLAVFHWGMDRYGRAECPFLGKPVFEPNDLHHILPRALLENSCLKSSDTVFFAALLVILIAWSLGVLSWEIWLFSGLIVMVNMTHRWSHRTSVENGLCISLLQRLRLVQTREHHAKHHLGAQDTHYAVLTNFLNPVLETLNVWRMFEGFIELVTGLKPKQPPFRYVKRSEGVKKPF